MIPRLKKLYKEQIIPQMRKEFGYKNDLAVPKIEKVVVNVGVGSKSLVNPKFIDEVKEGLMAICGQMPVKTHAKKSISGFKVKKGATVGLKVTLRKARMYDFLDKLINITLPRIRDFRGLDPKSFVDGTYNIGIKEHTAFPEAKYESVEKIFGVQVTIVTTAKTAEEAKKLLTLFGFPFIQK